MIVGDWPSESVGRSLAALRTQTSRRWTLTMAVSNGRSAELSRLVRSCVPWWMRRKVQILETIGLTGHADLLRCMVARDTDTATALLFPGDVWAGDAVAMLSAAVGPQDVAYADEDTVTFTGSHAAPCFKPEYSPDFLLSSNYIGRPLVVGAGLLGVFSNVMAADRASLEHECALRACGAAASVTHIPEILCHRSDNSPGELTAHDNTYRQRVVRECGGGGHVVPGPLPNTFRLERTPTVRTSVSVVVPFRDQPRFLRSCADSVWATTGTASLELEIVLIDNGSTDPETQSLVDVMEQRTDVVVVRDPSPFNWAALNNLGASVARGDVLVFLNNDVEARRQGWLSALCGHALRQGVGAVGARLLYPDSRVQHCGVVIGLGGAAGHPLVGLPGDAAGYLGLAMLTRECSAVTGACLATRREVFEELDGFDETLGVDLSDVDYCLRAGSRGYRTVFEPAAEMTHHESPSRGTAGAVGDIVRFVERWREYIRQGDPYFNPHLTRADASCGLARPEEEDIWNQWYSTVTQSQ
jgi:GT2 family glycosyltransferase